MKRLSLRVFFVCGFLVSLAWASPLFAQQEDVSAIRQKNAALEAKVKELETQLQQCTESRNRLFSEDLGWQNKKNWRTLEIGMKEPQVTKILGEPVKVIKGVKTLVLPEHVWGPCVLR